MDPGVRRFRREAVIRPAVPLSRSLSRQARACSGTGHRYAERHPMKATLIRKWFGISQDGIPSPDLAVPGRHTRAQAFLRRIARHPWLSEAVLEEEGDAGLARRNETAEGAR